MNKYLYTLLCVLWLSISPAISLTQVPESFISAKSFIDLKDYGAIPGADCSTSLASAAVAALASGVSLSISGDYTLQIPVTIQLGGRKLIVEGRSSTLTASCSGALSTGMLQFTGPGEVHISGMSLAYLPTTATATRGLLNGISFLDVARIRVSACNVASFPNYGIYVVNASDVIITATVSTDNKYCGIGLRHVVNAGVSNCTCDNNYGWSSDVAEGYGISCVTAVPPEFTTNSEVRITNNRCNNSGKGIDAHSATKLQISGNTVSGFERAGIYAVGESTTSKWINTVAITNNVVVASDATFFGPFKSDRSGIMVGLFGTPGADVNEITIDNNLIGLGSAASMAAGIWIHNTDTVAVEKLHISNNSISCGADPLTYPIYVHNRSHKIGALSCNNNIISAEAGRGVLLRTIERLTYSNNIFRQTLSANTYGSYLKADMIVAVGNIHECASWTAGVYPDVGSRRSMWANTINTLGDKASFTEKHKTKVGAVSCSSGTDTAIVTFSGPGSFGTLSGQIDFRCNPLSTTAILESLRFNVPYIINASGGVLLPAALPYSVPEIGALQVALGTGSGSFELIMAQVGSSCALIASGVTFSGAAYSTNYILDLSGDAYFP